MGPFPHDAPPAKISKDNPAGTDGFEFVEFAHPEPEKLEALFTRMGYVARREAQDQGDLCLAAGRHQLHSSTPRSTRFARPLRRGARPVRAVDGLARRRCASTPSTTPFRKARRPMRATARRSTRRRSSASAARCIYFVDKYGDKGSAYDADFEWLGERDPKPEGVGFYYLDHLTHNVYRGNMDKWWDFYRDLFNFTQIHFFDIEGKHDRPGLARHHLPCGKIRIPLNESTDEHSQIEEYLKNYKGEGIQHIAVGTEDIYDATDKLADNGREVHARPARRPITKRATSASRP